MDTFSNTYNQSPQVVKRFINSDDYFAFLSEYVKKFEMDSDTEISFDYILQDIAVKFLNPQAIADLIYEIKTRLNYDQEKASQLSHLLWTRFKPLVDSAWQKSEIQEKSAKESAVQDILQNISKQQIATKNILDLGKIAQKPRWASEVKSHHEPERGSLQGSPEAYAKRSASGQNSKPDVISSQSAKIVNIETKPPNSTAIKIPPIQPFNPPIQTSSVNSKPQAQNQPQTTKIEINARDTIVPKPEKIETLQPKTPPIPKQEAPPMPATETPKPTATKEKDFMDLSGI